MPKRTDSNERSVNRHIIRHRGENRRRKKRPKQVRVAGLVRVELLDQCASDYEEDTSDSRDCGRRQHSVENRPPKQQLDVILTENDKYIDPEDLEDENLVYWFITKSGQEPRRAHQAGLVNSFVHPTAFQELQTRSPGLPSKNGCLIEDRTNNGTASVALGNYKPLTVYGMYRKLMEVRFHPKSSNKPSADRRLIFVTDLDSHGVVALMATAPLTQVDALGDFFYYHIEFKPHIRVFNQSRGPGFAFSFHLPFYSWVYTHQEPKDIRLRDGRPLRYVHNMSFVGGESQASPLEVDYLCRGQISILITGMNHRIWTGYCFVDTYYHPKGRKQCVDVHDESGLEMDPFTDGRCDAGSPILDPGEYFLTCFEYQLNHFKTEWMNTAEKFRQKVDEYIDKFEFPSIGSDSSTYQESQQPLRWLRETRRRLIPLIASLERTISCWDDLTFEEQFPTSHGRQTLASIGETFVEARYYLKELQDIRTLCDEHEKMFNLQTIAVGNRAAHLQAQLAESTQTLSYFLLRVLSPVTLAAAILSMQEKAIPPFLGPHKSSFFILTPILMVLVFALYRVMHSWKRIQQYLAHWLERRGVEEEQDEEFV